MQKCIYETGASKFQVDLQFELRRNLLGSTFNVILARLLVWLVYGRPTLGTVAKMRLCRG